MFHRNFRRWFSSIALDVTQWKLIRIKTSLYWIIFLRPPKHKDYIEVRFKINVGSFNVLSLKIYRNFNYLHVTWQDTFIQFFALMILHTLLIFHALWCNLYIFSNYSGERERQWLVEAFIHPPFIMSQKM